MASGKPTPWREELRIAARRLPIVVLLMVFWIVATALGLALLVIPGVYLSVALVFAWPALVLKPMSLSESVRYSLRLTRRNFWRVSTIFSVAIVVLFVFYAVGLVFALLAAPVVGVADLAVATAISTRVLAVMGVFAQPFMCAVLIATYADLQARADATPAAQSVAAPANS
jgi:membrane-anchored glycerophosphoryl diester phosphodiesterase (GDPDase)